MDVDAPAAPAAAEAAPAPAAGPAADTPAPKKRGRPPGSRNKPKGEPCHAPKTDFHHLVVLLSSHWLKLVSMAICSFADLAHQSTQLGLNVADAQSTCQKPAGRLRQSSHELRSETGPARDEDSSCKVP